MAYVKELIALARSKPGEIVHSSPGVGNGGHLAAELFVGMAKVKVLHVPYKGTAPANVALLGGVAVNHAAHFPWRARLVTLRT